MKKIFALILAGIMILPAVSFSAFAADDITILVNGEEVVSDVPAMTISVYDEGGAYVGDRVMLPIRAISEKLNCDVHWNQDTAGVTLYRNNNLYIMWVGLETAFHLDGLALSKGYSMDVPPTIVDSRTLVPIRAVAEILGAEVNWIDETKTVDIKYDLGQIESNSGMAAQCDVYQLLARSQYDLYDAYINGTMNTVTGTILMENGGEIKFELYPEIAGETCNNFISLAKEGFYDNTIFHRVIEGFVAQGGGFDTENVQKSAANVNGEFIENGYFNLIPHTRGALSLARAKDYNSGSSQFFIVHEDSPHLNGSYAGFGRVISGMEIVDEICACETDADDAPIEPVIVKQIRIDN